MKNKLKLMIVAIASFCMIGTFVAGNGAGVDVEQMSMVTAVCGILIGVVVAVAMLPLIGNATNEIEDEPSVSWTDTLQTLVSLWPLLVIVGVMIAIISTVL